MNHASLEQPIPHLLIVSEAGSFAYYTFTNRLPLIIKQVIAENDFSPSIITKLDALAQDLLEGVVRSITGAGVDIAAWSNYVSPFLGNRIIDTPFYFAETYFYRRLLEATDYFAAPDGARVDPFELQKRRSLEKVVASIRAISAEIKSLNAVEFERDNLWQQTLHKLLYFNLWGNRIDLSLNPTGADKLEHQRLEVTFNQEHVILDETAFITEQLGAFRQARIDFIVDNAGLELVSDLFIIDFLLTSQVAEVVYVHLKSHPTFVSDAMEKDVYFTLDFLANDSDLAVQGLSNRLKSHLASKRLYLIDHFFWTSPYFFWQMPDSLRQELSQSNLVFIKGDANYRRLVGDCHWDKTSAFKDIVSYFPSALVVLRTLKSEVIVDLSSEQINKLNSQDTQWLTNGKWGVIQSGE